MSSKPNATVDALSTLPRIECLRVEGPDAADFLQRQCMNDVRQLHTPGDWQWNGLLSAKGRVLALFALLRLGPDGYRLVLTDGDAAHWRDALLAVRFRSKLAIEVEAGLQAAGQLSGALPAFTAPSRAWFDGDDCWLDVGAPAVPRALRLSPRAADPAPSSMLGAWALADLQLGLPSVAGDARDRYTPQMLALDRLAAFSVRKGCYPGQEIVARTHFLGQAKRQLTRLVADRALPTGQPVEVDGQSFPAYTHIEHAGHHELTAVLATELAGKTLRCADIPLRPMPFIDGLARTPD